MYLGFTWRGNKINLDVCLPMGCSTSGQILERFAVDAYIEIVCTVYQMISYYFNLLIRFNVTVAYSGFKMAESRDIPLRYNIIMYHANIVSPNNYWVDIDTRKMRMRLPRNKLDDKRYKLYPFMIVRKFSLNSCKR